MAEGTQTDREVLCTHVGGPWDGGVEKVFLRGNQTMYVRLQFMKTETGMISLRHRFGVKNLPGETRLVYKGCTVA